MNISRKLSVTILYFVLIGLWIFMKPSITFGDILTLNNGSEIFGEITFDGEKSVKLLTPTGTLEFPKDRVVKITREQASVNYFKFGKYFFERKDYTKSSEYFEKAVKVDPNNKEYQSRLTLSNQLRQSKKSTEADELIANGDQYVSREQYAEAINEYSKITTLGLDDMYNKRAFQKMSHVLILQANRAQEPGQREELVDKALSMDPNSAEAHYEKGMIHLQRNQTENAIKELELSVTIDPGFAKSHRLLGNLYYDSQQYLDATEHYEQLMKMDPSMFSGIKQNLVGSYLALGNLAYQSQKYDEARLWYEKYINLDPSGNWAVLYQAQYQLRKLEMDPTSAEEHFSLGLWCLDKYLNDEALNEFKTAYHLDPSMYKAKRKLVELYDKFSSALYRAGMTNLNSRQYAQAIATLSKITANYPESSFIPEARRLISLARQQWAEYIYADAKASFESNYLDRAQEGFTLIVQNFTDSPRFVDAQRMLVRTKSKTKYEESVGDERKQKLEELQKIMDSSTGEDLQAWTRIKELETMTQWDFEARLSNLTLRERSMVQRNLDKIVYLFYDTSKGLDKLRPIALKYSLPLADRSRVRTEQDYVKLLQFALLLSTSIGDDYYNAWQELIPYFGTNPSELEDQKSTLSNEARRLIEERSSEVYRILNMRSR